MSWAEDNGYTDYDQVWQTEDGREIPYAELEPSHIKNILRGLDNGASYYGQEYKRPYLEKALREKVKSNTGEKESE